MTEGFEMAKINDVVISERRECVLISIDQIADLDTIVSLCPMQLYL